MSAGFGSQGKRRAGSGVRWRRGIVPGLLALVASSGIASAGTLRVGLSESYPPLAFTRDGAPAGVEVDLAALVGRELGEEVVLVPMKFPELIPALVAGKVDVVMSGLSVTEERAKVVRFTEPYLRVGQMALIRADDLERSAAPDEMGAPTSRVGVKRGTTGEGWARRNLPKAQVIDYDTVEAGVEALCEDKVDYFVHDAPTVWRYTGRLTTRDDRVAGIYRPLTEEYLAWAVRKDDEARAARLDGALAALRASGELQGVLDQWIPVTKVVLDGPGPHPTAAPATAP